MLPVLMLTKDCPSVTMSVETLRPVVSKTVSNPLRGGHE